MKLLTVSEAATLLRLKPQTVYRMVRRGTLPSLRLGRQLRFDDEALNQWLRAAATRPSGRCPACGAILPAGHADDGGAHAVMEPDTGSSTPEKTVDASFPGRPGYARFIRRRKERAT